MNITKQDKKNEAIKRMQKLKYYSDAIELFRDNDIILFSEPPLGGLFNATDEDLIRIKEFEDKYNTLVYAGIRTFTNTGQMDSYLYVSDHKEEWDIERRDLLLDESVAYVFNHDMPDCSEIGSIGIKREISGGLQRTW